ncbi:hypothetical protein EUX98_g9567 [Antrodiella citrinella]|uniref:Uncharacterized protein n=1 Tax=Antrodiella citrinella TaxID=2447956 RepID=A0A4S4LRK4_9APHY|nr:hypothetical protein EUX98_g9567 [Antrodiella citrinella]
MSTNSIISPDGNFYPARRRAQLPQTTEEEKMHTTDLVADDDDAYTLLLSQKGHTIATYPPAVGSERAARRAAELTVAQEQNIAPFVELDTVISAREMTATPPPSLTSLNLAFTPFHLDIKMVEEAQRIFPYIPVPNDDDDEMVYPRNQVANDPWKRLQNPLEVVTPDGNMTSFSDEDVQRLEEGRYWKIRDKRRSHQQEDSPSRASALVGSPVRIAQSRQPKIPVTIVQSYSPLLGVVFPFSDEHDQNDFPNSKTS